MSEGSQAGGAPAATIGCWSAGHPTQLISIAAVTAVNLFDLCIPRRHEQVGAFATVPRYASKKTN
jgi:hypothetical protein